MIIQNIIFGLIGIAVGFVLIRYAYAITESTSGIGWIENHVGAGRTPDFYRIFGALIIFASMLLATGLLYPAIRTAGKYIAHLISR